MRSHLQCPFNERHRLIRQISLSQAQLFHTIPQNIELILHCNHSGLNLPRSHTFFQSLLQLQQLARQHWTIGQLVIPLFNFPQLLHLPWKLLKHRIGDRVIFTIQITVQIILEKLTNANPIAPCNLSITRRQNIRSLQIPILREHISRTGISHRSNFRPAFWSNPNLIRPQQPRKTSLHNIRRIPKRWPTKITQ